MKGIVYTSNTGFTESYAKMLGNRLNLPVYSLSDAEKSIDKGSDIIYLGWLAAGIVKGYKKAAKRYTIKAVCGVGMGASGSQTDDIKKVNHLPKTMPVFSLQGGFDISKLHGIYKFMMTVMMKTAGKGLADKTNRTPEEDEMLEMMTKGGSRVSEKNLDVILEWYEKK